MGDKPQKTFRPHTAHSTQPTQNNGGCSLFVCQNAKSKCKTHVLYFPAMAKCQMAMAIAK
jgi:hypothetical protein